MSQPIVSTGMVARDLSVTPRAAQGHIAELRLHDPMQDLGVLCMHTWRFGGAGECGGFASREDLFTAYEATSCLRIDPDRVRFWEAFSNLKWAIGCLRKGLAGRERAASASVEACVIGRRFEEPMWDFFEVIREA